MTQPSDSDGNTEKEDNISSELTFPPEFRIRKRAEFQKVYSGGRKCARRFVVVYTNPLENPDSPARLGVTASKKIGKAHVRNRAKRRLREIFRTLHPQIKSGHDVVINTRMAVVRAEFSALHEEVLKCLQELDLISTKENSGDSSLDPSTDC